MSDKVIVAKFGGSSMADATAMNRSAQIAIKEEANIVLVSATYGTTNSIIEMVQSAESGDWQNAKDIITSLKEKHQAIAKELGLDSESHKKLDELLIELYTLTDGIYLLRECSIKAMDKVYSIGERLSSILFTQAMKNLQKEKEVKLFDIRKVLKTNSNFGKAMPDFAQIKELSSKHLIDCKYGNVTFVSQGFIGSDENGATTTLGRGGSDYSASLIAEGLGADILQIWTDVAGIATTDPRICSDAKAIREVSFQEAAELATFGAKILHPTTLSPAKRAKIPVYVGSSFNYEDGGTWIMPEVEDSPLVRAMALKTGQSLLTLSTPKMLHGHGFLYNIFKVFNDHQVSVDSVTTSEISVSITVDDSTLLNKNLLNDLEEYASLKVEENFSLVSIIGNKINHSYGLAERIFKSLGDINVRMICQGASKHNFCIMVGQDHGPKAIKRLHKEFIG